MCNFWLLLKILVHCDLETEINTLVLDRKELMKQLDVCKTCGQVLTEDAIDYMMEK